ncbi:MAG TPA: C40 family peptidase [Lentimicrobium sp.]|nr:C40 family peptidase [Lentimicrobium sp.]
MSTGKCYLSIIPVRLEPSGRSAMVNQLLFGDTVNVLDKIPNWVKIASTHDNYEGWCESNQLTFSKEKESDYDEKLVNDITATFQSEKKSLTLVYGSSVHLKEGGVYIGDEFFKHMAGDLSLPLSLNGDNLLNRATALMGVPYLWGGRSPFGIDCSGLIQIAFKMTGMALPRDAWQQAGYKGEYIDLIDEAKAGDVAFFDNEEGRIIHTGILTGGGNIIHANGKVRVDKIDHHGIFNTESRSYSHKLRIIKRFGNY